MMTVDYQQRDKSGTGEASTAESLVGRATVMLSAGIFAVRSYFDSMKDRRIQRRSEKKAQIEAEFGCISRQVTADQHDRVGRQIRSPKLPHSEHATPRRIYHAGF